MSELVYAGDKLKQFLSEYYHLKGTSFECLKLGICAFLFTRSDFEGFHFFSFTCCQIYHSFGSLDSCFGSTCTCSSFRSILLSRLSFSSLFDSFHQKSQVIGCRQNVLKFLARRVLNSIFKVLFYCLIATNFCSDLQIFNLIFIGWKSHAYSFYFYKAQLKQIDGCSRQNYFQRIGSLTDDGKENYKDFHFYNMTFQKFSISQGSLFQIPSSD